MSEVSRHGVISVIDLKLDEVARVSCEIKMNTKVLSMR